MRLFRPITCTLALLAIALPLRAEDEEDKAKETPEEAFNTLKEAAKKKDGDGLWNFFSKATRKMMVEQMAPMLEGIREDEEALAGFAKEIGKTVDEVKKLTDEEIVKMQMVKEMTNGSDDIEKVKFLSSKVDGKSAVCEMQEEDKEKETLVLVLEEGRWRLDMEKTEKLKKEMEDGDGGVEEEEEGSDK